MELNKINQDLLEDTIRTAILKSILLSDFKLSKKNIYKVKSPTLITFYDYEFESQNTDRWMFLRIEDYSKSQKIILWINKIHNKSVVNFDFETFLVGKLKLTEFKNKFKFSVKSESDFKFHLNSLIDYIDSVDNMDFKNVLGGKQWLDLEFDWHSYK